MLNSLKSDIDIDLSRRTSTEATGICFELCNAEYSNYYAWTHKDVRMLLRSTFLSASATIVTQQSKYLCWRTSQALTQYKALASKPAQEFLRSPYMGL